MSATGSDSPNNASRAHDLIVSDQVGFHRGEEISPLISLARETIHRDMPDLLDAKEAGEWVAYSGTRFIGRGQSKADLYDECDRQGLGEGEFLILNVTMEQEQVEDAQRA